MSTSPFEYRGIPRSLEYYETQGTAYMERLGASTAEQLRSIPAMHWIYDREMIAKGGFSFARDYVLFTEELQDAFHAGHYVAIAKGENRIFSIRNPAQGNRLSFRIDAAKEVYTLSYAVADEAFKMAAKVPVLAYTDAGRGFTGTLIGVYAQCARQTTAQTKLCRFMMETSQRGHLA